MKEETITPQDNLSQSPLHNDTTPEANTGDDGLAEKATIVVRHTEQRDDSLLLRHCLRSLQKNLRRVNASVIIVGPGRPGWLTEDAVYVIEGSDEHQTLLTRIDTQRIILMTDRMLLANPVTLAEIAVMKALPEPKESMTADVIHQLVDHDRIVRDYDTHMPVMLLRDVLLSLVDDLSDKNIPVRQLSLPTLYFNLVYPDIIPIATDWRNDSWILPIVSQNPRNATVAEYLKYKKFLYVYPTADGPVVTSLLKFLTPDPAPWETDHADFSQD